MISSATQSKKEHSGVGAMTASGNLCPPPILQRRKLRPTEVVCPWFLSKLGARQQPGRNEACGIPVHGSFYLIYLPPAAIHFLPLSGSDGVQRGHPWKVLGI